MQNLKIENIQNICKTGNIKWTLHALKRIRERNINSKIIINAIMTGEIIEEYFDDKPFPSCLINSLIDDKHVHVVLSYNKNVLYLITAYYPNIEEWNSDFITRREKL